MTPTFPLVLQKASSLIPLFLDAIKRTREGLIRAMRSDRRESYMKLIPVMLSGCSLQHNGAICCINGKTVRPKTVAEMAAQSGLSIPTVDRLLAELRERGYLETKQVKRKNKITGYLEVSPGLRYFTPKFWAELGLLDLFKKSCQWAKNNCKRVFLLPFKTIQLKAKKTFVSTAKEALKPVMQALDPAASLRVKTHCESILAMIRQKR